MPISAVSTAILAHMIAINNVPPPPIRNIPRLKQSKHINYGQLNALCSIRGLQSRQSLSRSLAAHSTFINQYPKIFNPEKIIMPYIFKQDEKRKYSVKKEDKKPQVDDSHNIAVYIKKARGSISLYGQDMFTEKFMEFLTILKKLPVHRTAHEHYLVFKMLKKVPELVSQLSDEYLRKLSKNIISETWVKGSTVVGNDGFYIILKGLARPHIKVLRNLTEEKDSVISLIPTESFIFDAELKTSTEAVLYLPSKHSMLTQWSTFGSLEIMPETELDEASYSIVMEEDCEILKIPAKEYEKLKLEKIKCENMQKLKLIRKCPFYKDWPTLSIYDLVSLSKWTKFPPGHVLVESGTVISFVGFINSGYCNIYRNIVGLVKQRLNKVKKIKKLVYMGKLKENESFGEISVLLQVPFTCTVITGKDVELAIIEDKDILGLDPVTKELMAQTAKSTFGHLTDDNVNNEYIQKVEEKQWNHYKNKTIKKSLLFNGIVPGFGKWDYYWTRVPRNLKDSLVSH